MNATEIKTLIDETAAIATDLHKRIDSAYSSLDQAKVPAPFLQKARACASDLTGHLASHIAEAELAAAKAAENAATTPKA